MQNRGFTIPNPAMSRTATAAAAAAASAAASSWKIIPRPLLETILNNHAHHHRVPQPLLLHGPRGVGKSSLLLHRLLPDWNKGPHVAGYVDFSPSPSSPPPWTSFPPSDLPSLRSRLEEELESMADAGIRLGAIGSRQVFSALNRSHGLRAALRCAIGSARLTRRDETASVSALWSKAVLSRIGLVAAAGIETSPLIGKSVSSVAIAKKYSMEEVAYMREAAAALRLAKEVIGIHQDWRKEAVRHMNGSGGFSRSLGHSATDWPCLLVELLSEAAEVDFFQPKLVINNIDVLRKATSMDDTTVLGSVYHDSFIWRLIKLGVNERCLPVFLVTSDSYYSFQAFIDFGFKDIFISRETFGWTIQEAKLHTLPDFFSEPEWKAIDEVIGPNPRHLSELYALKESTQYQEFMQERQGNFEDIVDAYLAYLQVIVVNPAMESAITILQRFASDVRNGKIPEERLHFGAPWRHPPQEDDTAASYKWAKIQLIDFVQSLVNTEFGVNYLADYSFEILDDPSAVAMLEVGLLYKQRDPSFIRPITRGIQRCLVRWLVQERMQMSRWDSVLYLWQRIIRGRSYRHLMKEVGYK